MSTTETPVSGGGPNKGKPDGVSGSPNPDGGVHGRTAGGESGGGAYPNAQTGKTPENGGFMGHGGQTEMDYHGGRQAGNAPTGSDSPDDAEDAPRASPSADHKAHPIAVGAGTAKVVETSGVAEAEATGKVGTDAPYESEQAAPGSG